MICEYGSGKHKNSLSIDKIIPDKGYVIGNFVFASNRINMCKNDLTLDEIQKYMPDFYYRIKIQELSNIINQENVNLILNNIDLGIIDKAKETKGGFDGISNSPVIYIPTYLWILFEPNLYRKHSKLTSQKILYTLAHEFGHYQSFRDGYWSEELIELRTKNKEVLMEEEVRAWNYARKTLTSLIKNNFDWESFERMSSGALKEYKNREMT